MVCRLGKVVLDCGRSILKEGVDMVRSGYVSLGGGGDGSLLD